MRDRIERLYDAGSLDGAGVQNAVDLGWITQAEADDITA